MEKTKDREKGMSLVDLIGILFVIWAVCGFIGFAFNQLLIIIGAFVLSILFIGNYINDKLK